MRAQLLATASLLVSLSLCPAPAVAEVFNPKTYTLDNGLELVVVENHRAPVVQHMIWYRAGSADEPAAKAGLAHYLEHMMFKGTTAHPDMDFSATVAALGGEDNAFTSYDYTSYYQKVPPAQLETVMRMEAERMTGLAVDDKKAKTERSVIQQERGERNESTPEDRFRVALQEALYKGHPYARPVIGTEKSIDGLTADDIYKFYRAHYAPNNATLIVAGDVSAEDVLEKTRAIYGDIPRTDIAPRVRAPATAPAHKIVTVAEKEVRQPVAAFAWRVPSYNQRAGVSPFAFDVLSDLLDLPQGLLQQKLVYGDKLAVGLNATYDGDRLDGGNFSLSLSPRPQVKLETLEAAATKALAELQAKGFNDGEIARAKARMIESATLARDQLTAPGYAYGIALTTGQTVADVERWPDDISNVTTDDVNKALRFLSPKPNVVARLVGKK